MGEQQKLVEVEESAFQSLCEGVQDLIDKCPDLDIGPDRWLTQKIEELAQSLRPSAAREWAEAEKYRKLHIADFQSILDQAATVLTEEAKGLQDGYTRRGADSADDWCGSEDAKAAHDQMLKIAQGLRQCLEAMKGAST
jgi:hypothetical protein